MLSLIKTSLIPAVMTGRNLLILVLGCALLSIGRPAAAGEEYFNYYRDLSVGIGFDPNRSQTFVSPLASRTATRVTTGSPKVEFELLQDQEMRHFQRGFELDARLEAKSLAYRGSVSAEWRETMLRTANAFCLRMRYFADYGDFRIPNIALTPEAEAVRKQGWTAFTNRYGTHCIVGDRRQCFLVANYFVTQLEESAMRELGFSLDASGRWAAGSVSVNFRALLKHLVETYNVTVNLSISSVGGTEAPIPIENSAKVDVVLDTLANRSANLAVESNATSYGYIAVPWDELISFTTEFRPPTDQDYYTDQLEQWSQMTTAERRLAEMTSYTGPTGFYNYLTPEHRRHLNEALNAVRARRNQILDRVRRWSAGTEAPSWVRYPPIQIAWPTPWVQFTAFDTGNPAIHGYSYLCQFRLRGGNRFGGVRAVNAVDGTVANGGVLVIDPTAPDGLTGEVRIQTANANKDLHNWWLEVLNANQQVVLRVRMLKFINIHGEGPA